MTQLMVFGTGLYVRHSLSRELKILVVYFGLAFGAEVIAFVLGISGVNNLWVAHVSSIIEYGFLVLVFSLWQRNPILSKLLQLTIPLYIILVLAVMFYLEGTSRFNSFTGPVANLILVAASSYTLFELSKENFSTVFQQPKFWISSAVLVYYASTLVIFSLSNVLLGWDVALLRLVFTFHVLVNILANLIYTGGFLCQLQAQKSGGL